MSIIINKAGVDINDVSYGFLQVELSPEIELHYDRVSINTKCFEGLEASTYGINGYYEPSTAVIDLMYDVSVWVEPDGSIPGYYDASLVIEPSTMIDVSVWVAPIDPIIPINWERFDPIKVPFELEASTNLEDWSHQKTFEELISVKHIPYEYMAYEDDVFKLDPSSGEPVLDPCTNQPIIAHPKGELIKKDNNTYQFYTKVLDRFCEMEDVDVSINL